MMSMIMMMLMMLMRMILSQNDDTDEDDDDGGDNDDDKISILSYDNRCQQSQRSMQAGSQEAAPKQILNGIIDHDKHFKKIISFKLWKPQW